MTVNREPLTALTRHPKVRHRSNESRELVNTILDRQLTIGEPSTNGIYYVHPCQNNRQLWEETKVTLNEPYYPYSGYSQYKLAASVASPKLAAADVIKRVAVDGSHVFLSEDMGFGSTADFMNRLDGLINLHSAWNQHSQRYRGEELPWDTKAKFWYRNPLAVLQEIFENKNLQHKCQWGPVKEYNADGERVYSDMYTSDWWWEIQVKQEGRLEVTVDQIVTTRRWASNCGTYYPLFGQNNLGRVEWQSFSMASLHECRQYCWIRSVQKRKPSHAPDCAITELEGYI